MTILSPVTSPYTIDYKCIEVYHKRNIVNIFKDSATCVGRYGKSLNEDE
jgi:hypothetical protein